MNTDRENLVKGLSSLHLFGRNYNADAAIPYFGFILFLTDYSGARIILLIRIE